MMRIYEAACTYLENPLSESRESLALESAVADIKVKNITCAYPMIRALHSDFLTRNCTLYSRETLVGQRNSDDPTGYASFVYPHGKSIIREHRFQDSNGFFGDGTQADLPMGRIVHSTYMKHDASTPLTPHPKAAKGFPGYVRGSGYMQFVAAISDPDAIPRVLGGAYHTVSVGSDVEKVVESISGLDLVAIRKKGQERPQYDRGQMYEGKLSYWSLFGLRGRECSFVNNPSDVHARVEDPDIGEYGLRLLLAQKKVGKSQEYALFDPVTSQKVLEFDLAEERARFIAHESAWDTTFEWEDSILAAENVFLTQSEGGKGQNESSIENESTEETEMAENKSNKSNAEPENVAIAKALVEKSKILENHGLTIDDVFVKGESNIRIQSQEKFQEVSDEAVEIFGEWSVEAAKYAMISYLIAGEKVVVEGRADEFVPAGVLFKLEESNEFSALPTDVTWSAYNEGKVDLESLQLRLVAGRLADGGKPIETLTLVQIKDGAPIVTVEASMDEETLKSAVEATNEAYGTEFVVEDVRALLNLQTEEFKESINTHAAEEFKAELAYDLPYEYLAKSFVEKDADTRAYLAALVGVCRKHGITREQMESAQKVYKVFGAKVLENLLASIEEKVQHTPEAESQGSSAQESENGSPIQVVPPAIAAQEKTEESDTPVSNNNSGNNWKESCRKSVSATKRQKKASKE